MKLEISSKTICLWLMIQGQNVAECSMVMDLINNFASDGVPCLLLISDLDAAADLSFATDNVSKISLSLYNTNASLLDMSDSGNDCLYNLLIFESVDSSLQFLNRWIYIFIWVLFLLLHTASTLTSDLTEICP